MQTSLKLNHRPLPPPSVRTVLNWCMACVPMSGMPLCVVLDLQEEGQQWQAGGSTEEGPQGQYYYTTDLPYPNSYSLIQR